MASGYIAILMIRDPFRTYMQDITLRMTNIKEHKLVIAYLEFSRKIGTTILGILISALLIKVDMIYVFIILGILAVLESHIMLKLYNLTKSQYENI